VAIKGQAAPAIFPDLFAVFFIAIGGLVLIGVNGLHTDNTPHPENA
jgi:hypothetical protein